VPLDTRFYPKPEQEDILRRTLGCVPLVYNKALVPKTEAWYVKLGSVKNCFENIRDKVRF
jgi:putative transposase